MNAKAKITGGKIQGDTFTNHPGVPHVFGNQQTKERRMMRADRDALVPSATYHDRCRSALAGRIQQAITANILTVFPDDHELAERVISPDVWRHCQRLAGSVVAQLGKLGAIEQEVRP